MLLFEKWNPTNRAHDKDLSNVLYISHRLIKQHFCRHHIEYLVRLI